MENISTERTLFAIEVEYKLLYPRIRELATFLLSEEEFSGRLEEILYIRDQIRQLANKHE